MSGLDVDFNIRNPLEFLVSPDRLPELTQKDREAFVHFAYKKIRDYLDPEAGGNAEMYKLVLKAYEVYNESPQTRKRYLDDYMKYLSPQQVYDQFSRRVDLEWKRTYAAAKGYVGIIPDVNVPEYSGRVTTRTANNLVIALADTSFSWEEEYKAEMQDEEYNGIPFIRRARLKRNEAGRIEMGFMETDSIKVDPHKLPVITVFISKEEDDRGRTLRSRFEKHKILNFPALVGPEVESDTKIETNRYNTDRIPSSKMEELISLSTFGIDLLPRKQGDRVYLFSWNSPSDPSWEGFYSLEGEILGVQQLPEEGAKKEKGKKVESEKAPKKEKKEKIEKLETKEKKEKKQAAEKTEKPSTKSRTAKTEEPKSREAKQPKRKS